MARRSRLKSGRLSRSARKRKLAGTEPGAIVILDSRQTRKRKGGRFTGARGAGLLDIAMTVDNGLEFDGDIRKLTSLVQGRLADYLEKQLQDGKRADGTGSLPQISEATRAMSKGRTGGFGQRTGHMAHNFYRGPVRGTSIRAKASISPSRDPERMRLISFWLDRPQPIDLLAVTGAAKEVIADAVAEWQENALGEFVGTPTGTYWPELKPPSKT